MFIYINTKTWELKVNSNSFCRCLLKFYFSEGFLSQKKIKLFVAYLSLYAFINLNWFKFLIFFTQFKTNQTNKNKLVQIIESNVKQICKILLYEKEKKNIILLKNPYIILILKRKKKYLTIIDLYKLKIAKFRKKFL